MENESAYNKNQIIGLKPTFRSKISLIIVAREVKQNEVLIT